MRSWLLLLSVVLSCGLASAQQGIKQVDFNNFKYPVTGPLLGHNQLHWLPLPGHSQSKTSWIHLVHGSDLTKVSSFVMDGKTYTQWEGFTLKSVQYADLNGDGNPEAIIVLHYETGGTQNTNYIYIYTLKNGKPYLLAYCYTGDRADYGLYKVYVSQGALVLDLADPAKSSGDCCSAGIVRVQYRWRDGRFEVFGPSRELLLKDE